MPRAAVKAAIDTHSAIPPALRPVVSYPLLQQSETLISSRLKQSPKLFSGCDAEEQSFAGAEESVYHEGIQE